MIVALFAFLVLLAVPTFEQESQSTPISPCPQVFKYEPPGSEPGRWYGVLNLSTDTTLYSLWLNIVLDAKADILGNWIGDVTTQDNKDFRIENQDLKIRPGPTTAIRFFVQYNPLNKTPKLLTITVNGKEICNANTPRPFGDIPDEEDPKPSKATTKRPISTPVRDRPNDISSVGQPNPSSIDGGAPSQSLNKPSDNNFNVHTTLRPGRRPEPVRDDDGDYFGGGQPTFLLPSAPGNTNPNRGNQDQQCGKVVLNKLVPLVINGAPTLEGQWPWQIALYHARNVDNKYICGGTLVSRRHVITAAHCVTKQHSLKVTDKNTLSVYLGKHNLRTSVDGVQFRFVDKVIVHPEYNATYIRDLAILELREPVTYSDWVRPACLWPENMIDLKNIIGKKGSVVGWGFDERGVATEDLKLVEMPVVNQLTCIQSNSQFFSKKISDYTYCAGYRDGTSVCNGDSGGGMMFQSSGTWYLRGLVSVAVARQDDRVCDPSQYVIFTDLAKFLPWIRENISD